MNEILKLLDQLVKERPQAFDNLFSANQRNKMIEKYNYTEAQRVTVEDLLLTI